MAMDKKDGGVSETFSTIDVSQNGILQFHKSIADLMETFRIAITSITWLLISIKNAQDFYEEYQDIIVLDCSVIKQKIMVGKSILTVIEKEGFNRSSPLSSQTLNNFYRIFIIATKDILWEELDFQPFLQNVELQFLKHIRNASAHKNKFFWGTGKERERTVEKLPISWRDKVIEEKLEGTKLYPNFMKPGDLFLLLSDISRLA